MTFDTAVPKSLKEIQKWFGSIITMPIDQDNRMSPISPSGELMEKEACNYIAPSPTLQPAQRIEIYNQQYWWRLLSTLQENFPFLTRLFGHADFDQTIAVPFLLQNPPHHWSLATLGDTLPKWLNEKYYEQDRALVCDAAHLDWSFLKSYLSAEYPSVDLTTNNSEEDILQIPFHLQPHVELFQMNSDLFDFRTEFLKQSVEYWMENDFPNLKRFEETTYFALFRRQNLNIGVEKISYGEFKALGNFVKPFTINDLCDWLEKSDIQEEALSQLHLWMQKWTIRKILAISK